MKIWMNNPKQVGCVGIKQPIQCEYILNKIFPNLKSNSQHSMQQKLRQSMKKKQQLSIFSEGQDDSQEDDPQSQSKDAASSYSIKDQFVDQLKADSRLSKRPKINLQKSVCRAHGKVITRLCISNPCGAYQAGACDDCIKQFHNHKVGHYLRVSTFQQEFEACLYSKGKSDSFYEKKIKLVQYVREYFRQFAAKVYDVFDQTSKNIEKMIGNKQFFIMLKSQPNQLRVANQLRDKNYQNLSNPELVAIYRKMQEFERSGMINRDSQDFNDNLQFLKNNMLKLIDQTKKFIDLPVFDQFYTPFDFDSFKTSQPMLNLAELTAVLHQSEDRVMANEAKTVQEYRELREAIQESNWEYGVKQANELIIRYPRVSQLYHMKGICLSHLKGNELNAITSYNVCLALNPHNLDCILNKCELLLNIRKLDEVEHELRSKIPPQKYNEKAYTILGNYQYIKQEFKRAIECFDKVLSINSRNFEIMIKKGICLTKLNRLEDALRVFNFCLQINPDMDEAHFEKGVIEFMQGEMGGAARAFQQAIAINPNKRKYYDHLFQALIKLGREKDAQIIRTSLKYQNSF